MLCRDSRCSRCTISGGGGVITVTRVEVCEINPRMSVQVALTVIAPGAAPPVSKVAELPLPEIVPALAVQLATEVETPSGLEQFADRFTVPPASTAVGFAEIEMIGGFLGGNGLTVKFAKQLASLFFFSLGSLTFTLTA